LPTPTIGATSATLAGKYFNPVLYTGNASTNNITSVGFQPDLVWIKSRSNALNHGLYDAVRGTSKLLQANVTDAEVTYSNSVTAFNTDGFTLGNANDPNNNGATYVAWNWKANGSGSTNTAGTITSTVSANTTSGFSVVTYTGTGTTGTIGHGLGVAPSMIMFKARNNVADWINYVSVLGASNAVFINATNGSTSVTDFASTAPTSTVFTVNGSAARVGSSGWTYVAYCFAEVAGYSKFGSYTGNGSTDGPFVFTGFRPAFVMVKNSSTTGKWVLMDTSRGLYNVMSGTNALYPNLSDAEGTDSANREMDFLSNGFKLRCTGGDANGSGNTIIYMAFASSPFKFSLAR
jgi:aspartate 1-decarboxylase